MAVVDAASPPRDCRTVIPLRSVQGELTVHSPCSGRSRVGVPASAGSKQGPSGPRSPFPL